MPYVRTVNRQLAEVSCPTCNTTFTVDRDEDGGASIETWPCRGSDDCQTRMCGECRTVCNSCGLTACQAHLVDFSGERCCQICMNGLVEDLGELHDSNLDLSPTAAQSTGGANA